QQRAAIADLNQKLSQSQKMEAMGQLTGGVAHDFNNLLTVILGNSEHLADRLAGNKELHRIAGDIATAAERGSDLTRSLLAFAR
ncbi:histidine kinase dimerization/phospho-acceptor domain-containing protein, partial [Bradyrhizobium ottawaense]